MREKYRKSNKNLKLNKDFVDFDIHEYELKNLKNFENYLKKKLKKYKTKLKNHNVFRVSKRIDRLRGDILHDITLEQEKLDQIKSNKTKARSYYIKRIKKLEGLIKRIDTVKAKLKKKFDAFLKKNPNYFKKRYEDIISFLEKGLKRIQKNRKKILASAKVEQDTIILFYKLLLDKLRKGPQKNPDKF